VWNERWLQQLAVLYNWSTASAQLCDVLLTPSCRSFHREAAQVQRLVSHL
jgi:hypothetical protein